MGDFLHVHLCHPDHLFLFMVGVDRHGAFVQRVEIAAGRRDRQSNDFATCECGSAIAASIALPDSGEPSVGTNRVLNMISPYDGPFPIRLRC